MDCFFVFYMLNKVFFIKKIIIIIIIIIITIIIIIRTFIPSWKKSGKPNKIVYKITLNIHTKHNKTKLRHE